MRPMNKLAQSTLAVAERIVQLRAELVALETKYEALLTGEPSVTVPSAERSRSSGANTNAQPSTSGMAGAETAIASMRLAAGGVASTLPSEPVTVRVLKYLAGVEKAVFGEVYAGVLSAGQATKFAVRAALATYRKAGAVTYDETDRTYALATAQKENPGKPPAKVAARGRFVSGVK